MRPSGDIFSPSYSISSSVPVDCVWILSVYDGDKIAIGFNEFDLAVDVVCASEYVELRDGESDDSPLLGRYCESAPMVVFGSTNNMWVHYYSIGTGRKGFEATWTTMRQTMKVEKKSNSPGASDVKQTESLPHPPSKLHFIVSLLYHIRKLSCEQRKFHISLIVPSSIALAFIRLPIQIDLFLLSRKMRGAPRY